MIYVYPIFQWIAETLQGLERNRIVAQTMATRKHALLRHTATQK